MSNVQSYNALIDRFKAFASGHFILKSFSHGQIDTADIEKFTQYPFMHVVPSNVTYAQGTKTFSFQIVLADLPRDKDDKVEFQREVLSDLQRIAEDLVAEITNHRVLFGDLITVQNVSLEPFLEEFHNTLTGWTVSLDLLVPYYWDACSIPAEWNDFFESSTGGTGSILTFVDSITRDENGNVSLVNDEAEPSPNYYYGTNDEGVRGWYLLTDEVGLTCATIGSCQTIIDIESAIDDLQTEILLKANTADLGAVAFSNNYNDLDNKPTIPSIAGLVPQTRTITINGTTQDLSANRTWSVGDMLTSTYDTDVDGVVDSAERIQIVVRNSTGSMLTKGQIVYLSGATGNRPNAVLAQANAELTSSKTIGMVIADIANNADGQIAVNGTLHDLDTSAFTAGDTLWLSATTAGGMVANTPPSEPNHTVFIGYVARSHPNQGRIVLAIQNGYELDELHGVQITTPANNEVLTYESSSGLWKNKTVNAGTVTSVAVTAGTGISVTGSPITSSGTITVTNSAPDQVVALTAGTGIGVTGTYPNFTITNNAPSSGGTVTSVAALTLGTTGTDLSSTVANGTSTPVITLNVPTASATNRGVLSSTDWSTFNAKQDALGFIAENTANKQNSLATDGTGVKFPTVDAVNNLSMIDKGKRMASFFTDFLSVVSLDGLVTNASGGTISQTGISIPNRTNQQGLVYYTTATAATNFAYHINSSTLFLWFGGGIWNYETSININTLSNATERYRWISGFGTNTGNTVEIDGIFFTYDEGGTLNGTSSSPNWQCVTVANSVRTLTTTSTAVAAGAWTKLRIEINAAGTSVAFYVNATLVATHTTNIPLASNNRYVLVKQGINKTAGTTARFVYCDYLGYENILNTPR